MKRAAAVGALAVLACVLVAAGGRWERAGWIESQRAGMEEALTAIGGEYRSRRVSDLWDEREGRVSCLRYDVGGDPYAVQLCFDGRGRLIEAYDERDGRVRIYDLHVEPNASGLRISPEQLKEIRGWVVTTQAEIAHARRMRERAAARAASS